MTSKTQRTRLMKLFDLRRRKPTGDNSYNLPYLQEWRELELDAYNNQTNGEILQRGFDNGYTMYNGDETQNKLCSNFHRSQKVICLKDTTVKKPSKHEKAVTVFAIVSNKSSCHIDPVIVVNSSVRSMRNYNYHQEIRDPIQMPEKKKQATNSKGKSSKKVTKKEVNEDDDEDEIKDEKRFPSSTFDSHHGDYTDDLKCPLYVRQPKSIKRKSSNHFTKEIFFHMCQNYLCPEILKNLAKEKGCLCKNTKMVKDLEIHSGRDGCGKKKYRAILTLDNASEWL